jgi:hypothetical protein
MAAAGYFERFAGRSFENGLYWLHDEETGPEGAALIAEAFPDFGGHACPFGYDWLGRQFERWTPGGSTAARRWC